MRGCLVVDVGRACVMTRLALLAMVQAITGVLAGEGHDQVCILERLATQRLQEGRGIQEKETCRQEATRGEEARLQTKRVMDSGCS